MKPRVSIVVATYNYGRFLAEALDSIRAQTFRNWEAIIVDDGSTDDTSKVVRSYLTDARFHYVLTSHVGQPAAKNAGIAACRSDLIAFLDADDRWLPEKLAKQVPLFDANPEVGVVYCRRHVVDERGQQIEFPELECYSGRVVGHMFLNNFVCFSSSVVRRTVLDTVGRFNERIPLAIDYELWLRASAKYAFDYVDEQLVEYRTGHANLSRRAEERLGIALRIMTRFLEEHGGAELIPPAIARQGFTETYCSLAYVQRDRSVFAALRSSVRALRHRPLSYLAWRGIIALFVPNRIRSTLRQARGIRIDADSVSRAAT